MQIYLIKVNTYVISITCENFSAEGEIAIQRCRIFLLMKVDKLMLLTMKSMMSLETFSTLSRIPKFYIISKSQLKISLYELIKV